jgi:hypothetical protein
MDECCAFGKGNCSAYSFTTVTFMSAKTVHERRDNCNFLLTCFFRGNCPKVALIINITASKVRVCGLDTQ